MKDKEWGAEERGQRDDYAKAQSQEEAWYTEGDCKRFSLTTEWVPERSGERDNIQVAHKSQSVTGIMNSLL